MYRKQGQHEDMYNIIGDSLSNNGDLTSKVTRWYVISFRFSRLFLVEYNISLPFSIT
jgi:hypothetical protein